MSTTPDTPDVLDMEERLRAALAARAELVRPDDLAPLVPAIPLRSRWRSPWVLLATAAAVLLVLGVVLQGVGRGTRSDDVAPRPDEPRVELPDDVGRDWKADDLSTPARLDLDGDGTKEVVEFLGEPTRGFDGRTRLEATLSSSGEEAYGIAELGTTIGTSALPPIDADGDGDQELVLLREDTEGGPGAPSTPIVFDLRDGLLVQAAVEAPELLVRGDVAVPGSETEFYDLVHVHDFWIEDGSLHSSRSRGAYARGAMTLLTPRTTVVDAWEWHLDGDGVLRHGEPACLLASYDSRGGCGSAPADTVASLPVTPATYVGAGEDVDLTSGYPFTARLQAGEPAVLTVRAGGAGGDDRSLRHELDVPDPLLGTVQPRSVFADGASVVVTSASDPSFVQVLVQDGTRMVALEAVGEVPLQDGDGVRTWLTDAGAVLSAVAAEDGTWVLWQWMMVSPTEMAALPWGDVCVDDVEDPTTTRTC